MQTNSVNTMHILADGERITSREGFEKVQERFSWADKSHSIQRILKLRSMTEGGKQSLLVYYEHGHLIKEFINVADNFQPLNFV